MTALDSFKEIKAKYDDIISTILNEKVSLETQIPQAKIDHEQAVMNQVESSTKVTKDATLKAKNNIVDLKQGVADAEERLSIAKRIRNQRLKEIFPSVQQEFIEYQQSVSDEILAEADKLKELRCQFLLKAKELHDKALEARSLHNDIGGLANEFGGEFKTRLTLPQLNFVSNFSGTYSHLAPLPQECTQAYGLGIVPAFVEYFALTGDLLEDNQARQKLAELKGGKQ